jgi:hypothetical protein
LTRPPSRGSREEMLVHFVLLSIALCQVENRNGRYYT